MINFNANGSITVTLPLTPVSGMPTVPIPHVGNEFGLQYPNLRANALVTLPEQFVQTSLVPIPGTVGGFTTVTLMSARTRNVVG